MSKDLTAALQRLTEDAQGQTTRVDKTLPAPKEASPIGARVGVSPVITNPSGGIASPLVETAYADREWHTAAVMVKSMDLLYSLMVYPIKSVKFTDANGATVVMEYKAPA